MGDELPLNLGQEMEIEPNRKKELSMSNVVRRMSTKWLMEIIRDMKEIKDSMFNKWRLDTEVLCEYILQYIHIYIYISWDHVNTK